MFAMAAHRNFTQGRRTQHVCASCLYAVCRMEKSAHLLIDFADALQANVYELGNCFLKLKEALTLKLRPIDPSLFIHRFADRLEFGTKRHAVGMTALRLVARMKRDWIVVGRRPAGICAAALLIAGRMHGFRRTTQEVATVVRIGSETVRGRLSDFEMTSAAQLTPDEFEALATQTRDFELDDATYLPLLEDGLDPALPPSFRRNRLKESQLKALPAPTAPLGALPQSQALSQDELLLLEQSKQADRVPAKASASRERKRARGRRGHSDARPEPASHRAASSKEQRQRRLSLRRREGVVYAEGQGGEEEEEHEEEHEEEKEEEKEEEEKEEEEEEGAATAAAAGTGAEEGANAKRAPLSSYQRERLEMYLSLERRMQELMETGPIKQLEEQAAVPSEEGDGAAAAASSSQAAAAATEGDTGSGEQSVALVPLDKPRREGDGEDEGETAAAAAEEEWHEISDLEEEEVSRFVLSSEEASRKAVMWEGMYGEWMREQALRRKEDAKKVPRKKRRRRAAGSTAATGLEAAQQAFEHKPMSKKIDYSKLEQLFEGAPEEEEEGEGVADLLGGSRLATVAEEDEDAGEGEEEEAPGLEDLV